MEIGKVTVQGLFVTGVHYIVPSFQRRYVWKKDTQWEPLWLDVTDKACELMKEDSAVPPAGAAKGLPHFLGAMVLKQLPTAVGQPQKRLIVDGQQRLTTLQVMTLAVADALKDLSVDEGPELKNTEYALRQALVNHFGQDDDRYTLKPYANKDFRVFKELVDNGEPNDAKDHPLVRCHRYFKSEAVAWLRTGSTRKRTDALVDALFRLVEVVGLNLGPDEDEYVIFEALNARGTPLTEWEKSKNHLLSKSRQTSMGEREYYERFIKVFDESEWWNGVVSLPRFTGSRAELLLNYWLTIKLKRGVQAHHAYYELCAVVKQEADLVEMTESLCKYACIFRQLATQKKDHSIQGLFRYRLDVLRITVVMPLMMKLNDILGPGRQFDHCTRIIESYLVRRQVVRWVTRGYRALFIDLLKDVSQGAESRDPRRVLVAGLRSADWPSDAVIQRSVLQNSASPGVSSSRLRMILEAIEDRMIPDMAARDKAPRELWIEHIMPQKWQQHWPLPEGADHASREHAITTFGNLTLTTAKLDRSVSNFEWEVKRGKLKEHDNLFLNKWVLDRFWERWDEEAIEERSRFIAQTICSIWPSGDKLRQEFGLSDTDA